MPPVGSLPVNVQTMSTLFALLTVVAQLSLLAILVLAIGARLFPGLARARDAVWEIIGDNGIWLAVDRGAHRHPREPLPVGDRVTSIRASSAGTSGSRCTRCAVVLLIAACERDRRSGTTRCRSRSSAPRSRSTTTNWSASRIRHRVLHSGPPVHGRVDLALPLHLDPDDGPQRVRADHRAAPRGATRGVRSLRSDGLTSYTRAAPARVRAPRRPEGGMEVWPLSVLDIARAPRPFRSVSRQR